MWISKVPVVIYCNSLFILLASGHVTSDYDAPQEITFYHDLENGEQEAWIEKNKVKVHNINSGNVVIPQEPISDSTMKKLKAINIAGGFYKLKSVVKTSKRKESVFYSFMKMDTLIKAGFLTSTVVHLDQSGSVICVKIYPRKKDGLSSTIRKDSTVTFKASEQGPMPDLTSYILKLEREREAKEKVGSQDNRSFIARYWMYIVPLLIFVVLTGTSGDAGASRQQNR